MAIHKNRLLGIPSVGFLLVGGYSFVFIYTLVLCELFPVSCFQLTLWGDGLYTAGGVKSYQLD
jgi:hypothetical protein